MPRDVGLSTCIVCEAQVMVRENANGAAYYKCNGHVDENRRACGADVKFGLRDSRTLIEKLDAASKEAIRENDEKSAGSREREAQPRNPAGSDADGTKSAPATSEPRKRDGLLSFFE